MVYSSSGRCIRGIVRVATLDNCVCYVIVTVLLKIVGKTTTWFLFVYKRKQKQDRELLGRIKSSRATKSCDHLDKTRKRPDGPDPCDEIQSN